MSTWPLTSIDVPSLSHAQVSIRATPPSATTRVGDALGDRQVRNGQIQSLEDHLTLQIVQFREVLDRSSRTSSDPPIWPIVAASTNGASTAEVTPTAVA